MGLQGDCKAGGRSRDLFLPVSSPSANPLVPPQQGSSSILAAGARTSRSGGFQFAVFPKLTESARSLQGLTVPSPCLQISEQPTCSLLQTFTQNVIFSARPSLTTLFEITASPLTHCQPPFAAFSHKYSPPTDISADLCTGCLPPPKSEHHKSKRLCATFSCVPSA